MIRLSKRVEDFCAEQSSSYMRTEKQAFKAHAKTRAVVPVESFVRAGIKLANPMDFVTLPRPADMWHLVTDRTTHVYFKEYASAYAAVRSASQTYHRGAQERQHFVDCLYFLRWTHNNTFALSSLAPHAHASALERALQDIK